MAFPDFKSVGSVLREYPLKVSQEAFLSEHPLEVPEYVLENIQFSLSRRMPDESKFFYTENFVYPLLQLVWKRHPLLHIWSQPCIVATDGLTGEPDYLVSATIRGVTNRLMRDPLLAVTQAERENFDEGWGQCLAAMLASQSLNEDKPLTIYGIVSTGLFWEFGKLHEKKFSHHPSGYSLSDPALVHGMLEEVFAACEAQLSLLPEPKL